MNKILLLTCLFAWTFAAHGVEFLGCDAQVWEKPGDLKKAPALVASSQGSLEDSRHYEDRLTLVFNLKALEHGGWVALDGRYRMIPLNVHVKVKKREEGVKISLRDTVSGNREASLWTRADSGEVLTFKTPRAKMRLTCFLH